MTDPLLYDEKYVSSTEKARGLRGFHVVQLSDPFAMPPNIYPCMETDPIKAQQEAYWAMHMPEHNYNVALHFGLAQSVPQADFARIENALSRLPSLMHNMNIKGRIHDNIGSFSAVMRGYLNATGHEESADDALWLNFGERVMQSYAQGFLGSDLSYIRHGGHNDMKRRGLDRLVTHVHASSHSHTFNANAFSPQSISVMKLDPHNNTLIADSRDIKAQSGALQYQYNKPHIALYEAPPLVPLTFKTAGPREKLAVHSPMLNTSKSSMERVVWGIVTDYNSSSIAQAYNASAQNYIAKIQQQAFHQRNLELVR